MLQSVSKTGAVSDFHSTHSWAAQGLRNLQLEQSTKDLKSQLNTTSPNTRLHTEAISMRHLERKQKEGGRANNQFLYPAEQIDNRESPPASLTCLWSLIQLVKHLVHAQNTLCVISVFFTHNNTTTAPQAGLLNAYVLWTEYS